MKDIPGIVLVHGYSGCGADLAPLGNALARRFGREAVQQISLPGHDGDGIPAFTENMAVSVRRAVESFRRQNRQVVVVGHSTGGSLALLALSDCLDLVGLLVLAAVPRHVDISYAGRWRDHRAGRDEISFSSVANLISAVNKAGSRLYNKRLPVLIIHGEDDELVPATEATDWRVHTFGATARIVLIPGARHHLFQGAQADVAMDVTQRAIEDMLQSGVGEKDLKSVSVEPEMRKFLSVFPTSCPHLFGCPSGLSLRGQSAPLGENAATDPIFLNVEITTRCNLACAHCVRAFHAIATRDMTRERFGTLLDLLPHAYRVTLVGLGEPLLHPRIADMVVSAASRRRRVALVTNGMAIDESMALTLLDAGLNSIVFSLDVVDQDMATRLRKGTAINRVLDNIRRFTALARSRRPLSTAVFTAVSARTLPFLPALVDEVAQLGVHVMMLTDLNFRENAEFTVWKHIDAELLALLRRSVLRAFERKLPILSVRALEEFDLMERYDRFLLMPPDQLANRSTRRTYCYSPWQTMAVASDGRVTVCDCQPDLVAGNLFHEPFSKIWNGPIMKEQRRRMLSTEPPEACRLCPRF